MVVKRGKLPTDKIAAGINFGTCIKKMTVPKIDDDEKNGGVSVTSSKI